MMERVPAAVTAVPPPHYQRSTASVSARRLAPPSHREPVAAAGSEIAASSSSRAIDGTIITDPRFAWKPSPLAVPLERRSRESGVPRPCIKLSSDAWAALDRSGHKSCRVNAGYGLDDVGDVETSLTRPAPHLSDDSPRLGGSAEAHRSARTPPPQQRVVSPTVHTTRSAMLRARKQMDNASLTQLATKELAAADTARYEARAANTTPTKAATTAAHTMWASPGVRSAMTSTERPPGTASREGGSGNVDDTSSPSASSGAWIDQTTSRGRAPRPRHEVSQIWDVIGGKASTSGTIPAADDGFQPQQEEGEKRLSSMGQLAAPGGFKIRHKNDQSATSSADCWWPTSVKTPRSARDSAMVEARTRSLTRTVEERHVSPILSKASLASPPRLYADMDCTQGRKDDDAASRVGGPTGVVFLSPKGFVASGDVSVPPIALPELSPGGPAGGGRPAQRHRDNRDRQIVVERCVSPPVSANATRTMKASTRNAPTAPLNAPPRGESPLTGKRQHLWTSDGRPLTDAEQEEALIRRFLPGSNSIRTWRAPPSHVFDGTNVPTAAASGRQGTGSSALQNVERKRTNGQSPERNTSPSAPRLSGGSRRYASRPVDSSAVLGWA